MKKKILFVLFINWFNISEASVKSIDSSAEFFLVKLDTPAKFEAPSTRLKSVIQKNTIVTKTDKSLSPEEKQWNFLMRKGLLIVGTFIFLFVLFFVFRLKKK
jgi:hypothetical protein